MTVLFTNQSAFRVIPVWSSPIFHPLSQNFSMPLCILNGTVKVYVLLIAFWLPSSQLPGIDALTGVYLPISSNVVFVGFFSSVLAPSKYSEAKLDPAGIETPLSRALHPECIACIAFGAASLALSGYMVEAPGRDAWH